MKSYVSKEVKILSLSFFLIFLGFNGVQQYITVFFSDTGLIDLGFYSLILIYLCFTLSEPLSAVFVSKYGAKKCMIISSIFYSLFIISLLSKSVILIYLCSALLGIAASLLWTGQNSYLIRASDEKHYGENSGFFNALQSLGSAIGVFSLGFLISVFLFDLSFLFFSIIPMIGFLLLFKLKDLKVEQKKTNRFMLVKKSFTSITALRLSSIWFAVAFVFGLVIGIIPLQINTVLGMSYVGILFSIFHILPVFLSYFFGKLSDVEGREKSILFSYILLVVGLIFLSLLDHPVFLILGIFLFALNRAIIIPITSALVGDVSTKENLEYLTALFWMVQNTGVVSALILSQIFKSEIGLLYLISSLVIIGSLIILLPLMHKSTKKIREQIQSEVK